MTQENGLLLGVATHTHDGMGDWRGFWGDLIGRLDGAVDFLTLADGFARGDGDGPDALVLANWLAPRSRHVGIIAGAPVNYLEPFHVSTAVATLDYVSEGRAGLLVQRLDNGRAIDARRSIGRLDGFPGGSSVAQDRDALSAIEAIRRLWDSWEDDAVIRDVQSQRFLDGGKLHYIDYQGADFHILGPSITPRPPQGQPLVAIDWADGHDISPIHSADVVFLPTGRRVPEAGPVFVADLDFADGGDLPDRARAVTALGARGVRITLADPAAQLTPFLKALQGLREAGFVGRPAALSLRERFGLPVAVNRYTTAA